MDPKLFEASHILGNVQLHPNIRRFFIRTKVKILIVTDTAISPGNANFGLAKVIDIIESNEFFPCTDFRIHNARRRTGTPSINVHANSHQYRYDRFRFNMAGFDLNDYDQVWFFGFNPGNDGSSSDSKVNQSNQSPLSNTELRILTEWMDTTQGGVLAMGDHHYLGASMCSKIPRVRNMRRWTNAQQVPPIGGHLRHDTNNPVPYPGFVPFDAQEDNVPQNIEVLQKVYPGSSLLRRNFIPHPILCGVDGLIDVLPDHPHEGETLGVRYDSGTGGIPVNVNLTTGISGYNVAEYPAGINGNAKPKPEIIALGHPINDPDHDKNNRGGDTFNETTPFGLISVYDGEKAGIGRVVVDSTWHHWLNENLDGFDVNSLHYRKIRNYFKNIAAWLSRKTLRSGMMNCLIWGHLVAEFDPMRYSIQDSIWYLGKQAQDVLGKVASQCLRSEWMIDQVFVEQQAVFRFPPEPEPCLTCPPFEVLEAAMLGGIMKSLLPLVEEYRLKGKEGRIKLDEKEIAKRSIKGIEMGQKAYVKAFKNSHKHSSDMLKVLPKAFRKVSVEEAKPIINRQKLKVSLDSFIFHEDKIPFMLSEGKYHLEFDIHVNENIIKKSLRIPAKSKLKFSRKTSFKNIQAARARKILISDVFEDGEVLLIELFLSYSNKRGNKRTKLWERTFEGNPAEWLGKNQVSLEDLGDGKNRQMDVILDIS